MNRRTLLAALAAASARAAAAQPAKRLVFTAIPDQDETRLVERFGRVATYLETALGVPVGYVPVKSYPAAVTAFTNDQVQLAWFGGFTGVQARRTVFGSEAIARGSRTPPSPATSSPTLPPASRAAKPCPRGTAAACPPELPGAASPSAPAPPLPAG